VKLKTAAPLVPLLVIETEEPAEPVKTEPSAMVAADPVLPCGPWEPVGPTNETPLGQAPEAFGPYNKFAAVLM
jgi:hypothetical protein